MISTPTPGAAGSAGAAGVVGAPDSGPVGVKKKPEGILVDSASGTVAEAEKNSIDISDNSGQAYTIEESAKNKEFSEKADPKFLRRNSLPFKKLINELENTCEDTDLHLITLVKNLNAIPKGSFLPPLRAPSSVNDQSFNSDFYEEFNLSETFFSVLINNS